MKEYIYLKTGKYLGILFSISYEKIRKMYLFKIIIIFYLRSAVRDAAAAGRAATGSVPRSARRSRSRNRAADGAAAAFTAQGRGNPRQRRGRSAGAVKGNSNINNRNGNNNKNAKGKAANGGKQGPGQQQARRGRSRSRTVRKPTGKSATSGQETNRTGSGHRHLKQKIWKFISHFSNSFNVILIILYFFHP